MSHLTHPKQLLHTGLILLTFTAGLLTDRIIAQSQIKETTTYRSVRQKGYKYISPLLRCDPPQIINRPSTNKLSDDIQSYIRQVKSDQIASDISVFFRRPDIGNWFVINDDVKYTPASLIKTAILIAYYKAAQDQPNILDTPLVYPGTAGSEVENFAPVSRLIPQKSYTVNELINQMIIESDNDASDLLMAHLDIHQLEQVFTDLDLPPLPAAQKEDYLNISDYAAIFRTLYNSTYLNRDLSEKALDLLTQTKFTKGLVAGIPSGIPIAHKFGERSYTLSSGRQLHDCGIIYFPSSPYLLCVMTRGGSFDDLASAIARISSLVYHSISSSPTPPDSN